MQRLSEKDWKVFPAFANEGILSIATTSSSIDAVRLNSGPDVAVPYITRSDLNNGVSKFVSTLNYEFGSDAAGCITVGLDTQTAFYQPYRFVTGQNIQIITGSKLNEKVALFLVTILREQMHAKFNWGGNGATLGRMKRLEVMLPVDDSGNPDFNYMEDYASRTRGACSCGIENLLLGSFPSLSIKMFLLSMKKNGRNFPLKSSLLWGQVSG